MLLIDPEDMLRTSKCFTCQHRMSRVVEPITQEDIEYYLELLGINEEDDVELYMEQHTCLITNEVIDGIIRECTKYKPTSMSSLIREYKF